MKALVLSGGHGIRLRPISLTMPEQLVPIADKPVPERVSEDIRSAGVTEMRSR